MLEGSESYTELMNIRNAEVEKIETTLNEDIESAIANESMDSYRELWRKHIDREIKRKRKRLVL